MGEVYMIKKIFLITILITIFLIACNANNEPSNQETPAVETSGSEDVLILPEEELQKGDEGDQVTTVQQALIDIGYPIEVTGLFDEQTIWAITDVQLQEESLSVSGVYNTNVKAVLEQIISEKVSIDVGIGLNEPSHPNTFTDTIENPYEILVLVNKNYALPADFEPEDLVVPNVPFPFTEDDPKKQLRKEAAHALESLFAATEEAGLHLFAQSGYRSYDRQEVIFASNVERHGEEHANTYSARAGESEHQSGLVMDVTSQEVAFDLITDFGDTEEGKWLKNHAHEYGFIIRYPEGKEHITKYQYEPWHLRYVGVKAATEIMTNDLTLEEYLGAE